MPIDNITQTVSTIPAPPHRGVNVQTIFVTKQEDFQDHLQGITVDELNALVVQQNTMAEEMNSTATQVNTNANTATTKAGEASTSASSASTSASQALTSRNQAETFAQQAQASAESVDASNIVHRTGNETITGVKTFSDNIIGSITGNAAGNSGTTTKLLNARTINGVSFDGSANITVEDSTKVALEAFTGANVRLAINGYQKLPSGLIIQWGSTLSNGVGYSDFTYPIAFPNSVLTIIPTSFIGSGSARYTVTLDSNESNYYKARVSCWFGDYLSSLEGQVGVNWLVIGY